MNYISEDFHYHYIPSYTLYVQSNLHSDHIIVLGPDNDVLVNMVYSNESPTPEATKILGLPFEQVYISLPHQNLLWIPSEVFELGDLGLYTEHFLDSRIERIAYKEIEGHGITALYQIDAMLENRWLNAFPHAQLFPTFLPVIKNALNRNSQESEVLGIHIYDTIADIFLLVNNEIRLYNTFEIQTPDDLSFYVLSIIKNFGLHGSIPKILLSGASKDSEWGERLAYYTSQVEEVQSTAVWKTQNEGVKESIAELNILVDLTVCE